MEISPPKGKEEKGVEILGLLYCVIVKLGYLSWRIRSFHYFSMGCWFGKNILVGNC